MTPSKGSSLEPLSLSATIANGRQRTFSTSILKRKRKGEVAVIAAEESAINELPPSTESTRLDCTGGREERGTSVECR